MTTGSALITVIEVINSINDGGHNIRYSGQISTPTTDLLEDYVVLAPSGSYTLSANSAYLLIIATAQLSLTLTPPSGPAMSFTVNTLLLLTQAFNGGTLTNNSAVEVSAKIISS